MKLLLIEDEPLLSKHLAKGLQKLGYAVDCAFDGEEGLALYEINDYDLLILDLNLPKLDGGEILKTIRKTDEDIKVLILSARDTVEDKVEGLDNGCNDYLTKPFHFAELEARIRSLLRRQFRQRDVTLGCGLLTLDTANHCAYYDGAPLPLTKKEYGILHYLMHNQNRTVSAEEIIEHVWDSEADLFSNAFRVQIHSLRKKLEQTAATNQYITTVHGQGYCLAQPKEANK